MGRPVILGNGSLTVGLNEHGLVHDFYYPYVGLENLTTARSVHHLIGVWVDGEFSWIDDGSWDIRVDFEADALVSVITMDSERLGVGLKFNDFIDPEDNVFCRKAELVNNHDDEREIRLFFHQVFQISQAGRADTALFEPQENYILDYKGRCSLLIYARDHDKKPFDRYAIGSYGIEGKEGTFKDAEDGELSGSPIEHGGVDSVLGFSRRIAPHQSTDFEYWIVAADSQYTAEKIHLEIKRDGLAHRLAATRTHWHAWLANGANGLHIVDGAHQVSVKKSLMIIKAHTDLRGGVIASADSSIYNYGRDYYSYVWPRDGAYAMWPLIRLGFTDEPKKFFEFCRDIMTKDGYLMHKYQPDRAIGSTWHPMLRGGNKELPIQEDETAIVVYMLGEYMEYAKDTEFVKSLYPTLVKPAADFMCRFIDDKTNLPHASYDLWEEKFLTTTYSAAVVYQSLLVAADLAESFEHADDAARWNKTAARILDGSDVFFDPDRQAFRKGFLLQPDGSLQFDNTLDVSSLYGPMMYGLLHTPEMLTSTVKHVETTLLNQSPIGGSPRYEHDNYFAQNQQYLGNPWFVTTLWLSQYYVRIKDVTNAKKYVDWSLSLSLPSGVLAEQIHPDTGAPVSVTPLVWSHAELINTILDIALFEHANS